MNLNEETTTKCTDGYALIDVILALRSDYKKLQSILDEITRNICVNSKYYTNVRADILAIEKTEDLCFSYKKRQSVFREKIHNLYERLPWAMLKTNTAVVLKNELGNYYLTKNIGNIIDQEILEYHLDLLSKRQFANSLHHKCSTINHKDYMILSPTSALFSFVNSALLVYFSHTDSIIYSPNNNQNDFSKLLYERIPESVFF